MRSRPNSSVQKWALATALGLVLNLVVPGIHAQSSPNERTFPQSKAEVERALKVIQAGMAGHLPVLDGFALAAEHSLDHYQRGYYQATAQVSAAPGGGSLVRIGAKITAWYADPAVARSGYQLLPSNGRLEADLLDQLEQELSKGSPASARNGPAPTTEKVAPEHDRISQQGAGEPKLSASSPKFPNTDRNFSTSLNQSLAAQERAAARPNPAPVDKTGAKTVDKTKTALEDEARGLEEILKNQAHPKNLVAVKKSGTPVVASPSLNAKAQFLASMHDEFEMLDFNADWVHVRISGLSRGWIWRNSVEMPEGIPDTLAAPVAAQAPAADLFRVQREETAPFPGDWPPLRGTSVQIISVQKVDEAAKDAGPRERLEYAKYLLEKNYAAIAQAQAPKPQIAGAKATAAKETGTKNTEKSSDLAGIVLIFDSADGGMIAAPLATLQQWRAGKLSDSAFWHKCFFDPPETFDDATPAASP